ncbi:MAG: molybdopterin-guanine dinucleotide biosynthesis protein MobB, partial [Nitrospirota bacterium]
MSIPILFFVGRSNSGKTTLIERLIPELVRAGYRVATIKHAGHG